MKAYLLTGVLCLTLAVPGCAWFRETTLEAIDEYTKTVEMEMEATRRLLKVWPYRSYQLRAALGSRYGSLPGDVTKEWEKIDKYADKTTWTDKELGTASGTWVLMSYEVVREAVKQLAPDIIGLLPAFL